MKPWRAYLWKEWQQNKLLAWAGLGLFLMMAYVPIWLDYMSRGFPFHYDPDGIEGTVLWGGPVLAILLGVLAMGREHGKLTVFWHSRPVAITSWYWAKVVMGLGLLALICGITLGLNMLIIVVFKAYGQTHLQASLALVEAYSFFLILVYTLSFFMGILIHKPLNAMLLSLVGVAVMVLAPLVIAPLHGLSLDILRQIQFSTITGVHYVFFVVTLVLLSGLLLGLSHWALQRGWQVRCDHRVLWVSCVLLVLLLVGGIAFPLGTDIPCQQMIPLPMAQDGGVTDIVTHGARALVLFSDGPDSGSSRGRRHGLVQVQIGATKSTVGQPVWFLDPGHDPNLFYGASELMWSEDDPNMAYVIVSQTRRLEPGKYERHHTLMTVSLEASAPNPVLHQVDLDPWLEDQDGSIQAGLLQGNIHLYIQRYDNQHPDPRHLVFSLETPQVPSYRASQSDETHWLGFTGPGLFHRNVNQYELHIVADSSLDPEERLSLTHQLAGHALIPWIPVDETHILVAQGFGNMRLQILAKDGLANSTIELRPVGEYESGPIQKLLNWGFGGRLLVHRHKLLECQGIVGLTVYDISDLKAIKRIGHYAAGDPFSSMVLLDDGRVLLGGEKLHILAVDP